MNKQMIHSMAFGRAFWLDDDDEFCSAPWLEDGTVDMEQMDYVGEDNDVIPFPRYEIRERLDKYVSQFMKSIEVEGDND